MPVDQAGDGQGAGESPPVVEKRDDGPTVIVTEDGTENVVVGAENGRLSARTEPKAARTYHVELQALVGGSTYDELVCAASGDTPHEALWEAIELTEDLEAEHVGR